MAGNNGGQGQRQRQSHSRRGGHHGFPTYPVPFWFTWPNYASWFSPWYYPFTPQPNHAFMAHYDPSLYMDSGASTHVVNNPGILPNSSVLTPLNSSIIVGNGKSIPLTGTFNSHLPSPSSPLQLNNVNLAPQIFKNLLSVRQFTKDNNVSVTFDPLGLSVKDLQTDQTLLRCNSHGPLYPITPHSGPQEPSSPAPVSLAAVSPNIWHNRLGHPGPNVLSHLRSSSLITCTKERGSCLCHACQLGKHFKLPFYPSQNITYAPFDIIHSDLWHHE